MVMLRALGGAVVVGASMGGTSAMCAAPQAGKLMKALILVDISIHNEPKWVAGRIYSEAGQELTIL